MNSLPKDVITLIFLELNSTDRLALLSAFPDLRINWQLLYNRKTNPLQVGLKKICDKYFPETLKDRLNAMKKAYRWLDLNLCYSDNEDRGDFYNYTDIPIINTDVYKVEDYVYSITDTIFKDIYNLKRELNKN
jgi:hypothetical protein